MSRSKRSLAEKPAPVLTENTDVRALLSALLDDRTENHGTDVDAARQKEIDRRLQFAAAHPKSAGHQTRRQRMNGRSRSLHDSMSSRSDSRPARRPPSLDDIDAFIDARAPVTGTPVWGAFESKPTTARKSGGVSSRRVAISKRSMSRPALLAAGLCLCSMVVWLVLR